MARNGVFSRWRRSERVEDFSELSPSPEADELHVLAVDDSLVDRKVIERLLKITSCKVTTVDSGRRALQFLGLDEEKSFVEFDDLKVDLIITDYCMPGMTGYELLKRIKGSSFRGIPVVIMSSENVMARIDRCLEEGAEDFIVKPVKLADVKRLKNYMSGEHRTRRGDKSINKRKLEDTTDDLSLPSRSSSLSSSSSASSDDLSSTPWPVSASSPSSPKASSPSSSTHVSTSSSPPNSPDSPTRQRMSNTE